MAAWGDRIQRGLRRGWGRQEWDVFSLRVFVCVSLWLHGNWIGVRGYLLHRRDGTAGCSPYLREGEGRRGRLKREGEGWVPRIWKLDGKAGKKLQCEGLLPSLRREEDY